MKEHHWGLIVFLLLMFAMLVGGVALFVDGAVHPQAIPLWRMLLPRLG